MTKTRRIRLFAALAALFVVGLLRPAALPAAGEPRVARGAAAAWIDWIAPPTPNPARLRAAQDGVYDLVYDVQTRLVGPVQTTFRRRAMKVVERAGLETAASTQIDFDPAFEHLVVNRVAVVRDGRVLDRTAQADISILHREQSLKDGIVTGMRTAVVRLDDVEVGDTIDIAWSWVGDVSAWPGHVFDQPTMGWSVPMGVTRYRLIVPAATPITIRRTLGVPAPTVRTVAGMVERDWRVVDADPIPSAARAPDWAHGWPYLDVSTMRDWSQVAAWGTAHFAGDRTLPPAFAARLDAIAAASSDPAKRAIAALRLVQDRVRYTSLSIGAGGYVPRSPATVVASGFGDCKDKSQLLAVALNRLGIAAWPALTDIDEGPGLARRLPSANAFDHAIVLARIGGHDRWFDPTMSYQGGTLGNLATLPYGYALPLRAGQAGLVAIPDPTPTAPTMASVETYARDAKGTTLAVETVFGGDEADAKRFAIASDGIAKLERDYLKFYRDMYPGLVSAQPLAIHDDRDANRLVVREAYRLPTGAKGYARTIANLQVLADTMRGLYKDFDAEEGRTAPISLPQTIDRTHRIVFDLPGYAIDLPRPADSDGPAFTLTSHGHHDGDRAILDFALHGKAAWLPGSAQAAYLDQAKAIDAATNWTVDTSIVRVPAGPVWPGIAAAGVLLIGFVALVVLQRRRPPAVHVPRPTRDERDAASLRTVRDPRTGRVWNDGTQ